MVVDTHGKIPVMMTIGSPTTTMFASIDVPPNLKGKPLNLLGGFTRIIRKFVLSFFWPYRRPLNYFEYKKDFDSHVHLRIFKAALKANGEIIDEEITNLFNSHSWTMHQIGEIIT
jgi:hypothetical protein